MRADSKNPILIQVTSRGQITGTLTVKQFREYMDSKTEFLAALIDRFNEGKARIGEPERVSQILNAK